MSSEPDPQAGSQMRAPGLLLVSRASREDTSAGVKNSPAYLPDSLAKVETRYM